MTADVEQEILVIDRAAYAADVVGIRLDDRRRNSLLGQQVRRGKAGWPGPDDEHFAMRHEIRLYRHAGSAAGLGQLNSSGESIGSA